MVKNLVLPAKVNQRNDTKQKEGDIKINQKFLYDILENFKTPERSKFNK